MSANLDDARIFKQYDPQGMLAHVGKMPWQCRQAWQMALDYNLPADYAGVDKVIILGMGGSSIGGNLVGSLISGESRVPVIVNRDHNLPAFVDARTLVIASSYSGNTEEVLSAFDNALKTDCKKLVITTGGKLKAAAEKKDIPVFSFSYKSQPRAALSFSLLPLLCFLQKLGFIGDKAADVAETEQVLQGISHKMNEQVPSQSNPAKQLAQDLHGKLPVIYGAGYLAGVARRWKTQFNENSKAWAFHEVFPELNHNAVVGYQFPVELADRIKVVMLRSPLLPQRIQRYYQVAGELLEQAKVGYKVLDGEGSSSLSQMMSLIMFGDYVSCYLAVLNKVDPSPVEAIDYLKRKLSKD